MNSPTPETITASFHPVFEDAVDRLPDAMPEFIDRVLDAIQVPSLLPDYFVNRICEESEGEAMVDVEPME